MSMLENSNKNNELDFDLSSPDLFSKNAFFDYYGATINTENVQGVVTASEGHFNGEFVKSKPKSPFSSGYDMVVDGEVVFTLSFGGENPNPYIESKSFNAISVSKFIRDRFPDHSVARLDTAIDFDESGAFETLVEMGMYLSEKYNLKVAHAGDWSQKIVDGSVVYTGKGGKTLYIGSRTSVAFMRIYEKGKKMISKKIDLDASEDWSRVEVEIKPKGRVNKVFAARLSPFDAFGCSKWSKEIPELLSGESMPRVKLGTVWKPQSDLDVRLHWLIHQYGKTLEDILQERCGGCSDALGSYLVDEIIDSNKLDIKVGLDIDYDENLKRLTEIS